MNYMLQIPLLLILLFYKVIDIHTGFTVMLQLDIIAM